MSDPVQDSKLFPPKAVRAKGKADTPPTISFRCSPELYEWAKARAEAAELTLTDLCVDALTWFKAELEREALALSKHDTKRSK